jgi:CRP-like cAMP-binding protein
MDDLTNRRDPQLLLDHVARHISLNAREQELFLTLMEPGTVSRKSFLLRQGEICRYETFILHGCLRTYNTDQQGTEHTLTFGVEDWWVGDLYSFLTISPSNYNIVAIEETDILQISQPHLEKLYREVPQFERFFRLIIQNALIAQQQRINQSLSMTGEERYRQFVLKYPKLEQRVAQKHVASYLGITPEFLSMIRRKIARS